MTEEELKLLKDYISNQMNFADVSDPKRGVYNLGVYMAYTDVYNFLHKKLYKIENELNEEKIDE